MTRLLIALAFALTLSPPARGGDKVEKMLVFAVGVSKYDKPSGLNDISGPDNDARGFADRFRQTADALGLPADAVRTKTLIDEKATRRAIQDGLLELRSQGAPNTLAVIVLSGHGGRRSGRWEFCPHDYRRSEDGGVSGTDVLLVASRLASAGCTVLVVIDACHAAELRNSDVAQNMLGGFRAPEGGGVALFLSSVGSQSSLGGAVYSKFAGGMLEALSGAADRNADAKVILKEATRYMTWRVRELVREGFQWPGLNQQEQDFVCDYSLSLSDSLVLAASKPPSPFARFPGRTGDRSGFQPRPVNVDLHTHRESGFRPSSDRPWLPNPASPTDFVDGVTERRDFAGTWRFGPYTLTLGKVAGDGWGGYTAEIRNDKGQVVEIAQGRYQRRVQTFGDRRFVFGPYSAPVLVLESDNEQYRLMPLAGAGADELKFATDSTEYFVWAMAKKMIAKPELRADFDPKGTTTLKPIEIRSRHAAPPRGRTIFEELHDRSRGNVVIEPIVLTLKRVK